MMLIQMSMIAIICLSVIFGAETFNLKDGSSVTGERVSEDETSIKIKTVYGEIEIKKQDLVIKDYKVELKTGDTLIGVKIEENDSFIILETKAFGEIKVIKNDILSIQELNINEEIYSVASNEEEYIPPKYTGGLLGIVTSGSSVLSNEKDLDFTEGEEQLIDIFLEPSAHTLKRSTLYMSGFSFGFGLTDNMQITTRWIDYFHGDINFRMKYKLFSKGNWKKQSALALGIDYHQRWKASIVDQFKYVSGSHNHDNQDYYYGGWIPITSEVTGTFVCNESWDDNDDCHDPEMKLKEDNYNYMFEFFGAYTFSKARANLKGQINQTIGARALVSRTGDNNAWEFYPAAYYAADFDLTPKFKILFQAIYDNHMVETYQLTSYDSDIFGSEGNLEASKVPVVKEESMPIHFDFGFVYALNKNFRFAIHFQRPFIGFYWKL